MKVLFLAGAIARVAYAWVDPAPSVTDTAAMRELGFEKGFSPKPTTAPMHRDLLRRQAGTSILGYLAPDNTCGYVDGLIGAVKTCDPEYNCAAVLGDDNFYTMGCCGTGACTMYGACYDYASLSACDHACQQDANVVKCSGTAYPYCYGYSVPGMSMGFYSCDSTSAATFDEFDTTYQGEVGAKTWLALRQSDISSLLSSSAIETPTTNAGAATFALTSAASTGNAGASTTTNSASASTQTSQPQEKKSTPIGAIVGGAVGGVAVLGAIIGAIVFFLVRKKNTKPATGPADHGPQTSQYAAPNVPPAGPTYPQSYQPPNDPGNTASGYFVPTKMDHSDAKYDQNRYSTLESQGAGVTPVSPAPAYSIPVAGPPPPQMLPSPAMSPHPPADNRFSAPPPPGGWVPQPQPGYPPAQQPAPPAELGNTFAVPSQYQGRPVFEAA